MTVGTGIFLSAIFIGFIALFVATKDRWKWKKIVLWFGGIVGLFVIGFFGLLAYENRPDPPKKLAEFWNIPLDISQDEVLFRKGKPSFIVDEGPNAEWLFTYDKGYANYSFEVSFKDNKVRTVFYRGPSYESPNVGGVEIGNSQEQLIKEFGQPSSISNSNDSLRRFVHFSKYNLFAGLEMNQVIGFGIYNPAYGDLEFAQVGGIAGRGTYDDILQDKTYPLQEVAGGAVASPPKKPIAAHVEQRPWDDDPVIVPANDLP